ncbi:MAG: acetate--CoA ligase family protein [bacterium]|nr:acetate--CoA ligase family protein [bacterium]
MAQADQPTPLKGLFAPSAVAIVGASRKEGKIGYSILRNVIDSGYGGELYPINPNEDEILGRRCYASLADCPGPVDLAVIAVPAAAVAAVAEECGCQGVKSLVVITAGYKEIGREGLAREKELLATVRRHGMRMLGPNCLGLMDTHTPLNASFAAGFPLKGDIAFLSQSGAVCAAILDWSLSVGLGFSKFVSLGNKADLTETDFIRDAALDTYSKVILCYIEDVVDGEAFLETARQVGARTPVVILKSGSSQAGARAASSHTGALAGSDLAYEVAFSQAGVLRARTMEELFDLAIAFTTQPLPVGDRVGIVTNSGGPGIIATDAVEARGLKMAELARETVEALRQGLPPTASFYNPVDVIGDADDRRYDFALSHVLADPGVDSVVCLLTRPAVINPALVARAIVARRREHPAKPVVAAFLGGENVAEASRELVAAGVPCFSFPERAVTALSGLARYRGFRERDREAHHPLTVKGVDRGRAAAALDRAREDRRVVLLADETMEVMRAYGVAVVPSGLARGPEEAVVLAKQLGYPVALKVASPQILHKTDFGGVRLGIKSPKETMQAFFEIVEDTQRHLPRASIYGVEVQKMMPPGTELIVGMSRDVHFGPLLMFGLGGIYVNLFRDVSFRLARGLTWGEIEAMLADTKAFALLKGYRGKRPADVDAVIDTLGRVAALVLDFPEIAELDVNPLFAYERGEGVCALDVKITLSE